MARKRKNKTKKISVLLITVIAVLAAVGWHFYKNNDLDFISVSTVGTNVKAENSVHFIDVGQGDCELIRDSGKTVLIDGGEKEKGTKVVQYLKSIGVSKIDYMIGTHPHTDHIGGLIEVIKEMPVENVIIPEVPQDIVPTTKTYTEFLNSIADKNINVVKAGRDLSYDLGYGSLEILGPLRDNYTDLNSLSVPAKYTTPDKSFLLCGDAEKDTEQDLIKSKQTIKSDVLKLNHHGSNTSSTKEFLRAVNANTYVIEVGNNNKYKHPSLKVLQRLEKIPVYRTDINGTIVFSKEGNEWKISTEK